MRRSLSSYTEKEREEALERYRVIQPKVEHGVPLTVIAKGSSVSLRTLQRWHVNYIQHGLVGLIRKSHHSSKNKIDEALRKRIEQLIVKHPHSSIAFIHRELLKYAQHVHLPQPSYSTVYQYVRKIPQRLRTLSRDGVKAYREKYDPLISIQTTYPNELWQADHTVLDLWVLNKNGKPIRPWLTIIIDDFTRMIAGYYISEQAPNIQNTCLAFHQAIWRKSEEEWPICGIPDHLYTDHGADFTSHHLEQVALALKCQLTFSEVGFPRGRGKIERLFRTLDQLFFQHCPGHLLSKKEKRALLTLDELKNEFHQFILQQYHYRPHSSLKKSPMEAWNHAKILPRLPESLEEIDLLLLTLAKPRIVRQDGIHFKNNRYYSSILSAYVGEQIIVRYHPYDLAQIRIFFEDRFLCNAICFELLDAPELNDEIRKVRTAQLREDKNRLKQSTKKMQHEPKPKKPSSRLKRYEND